MDETYQIYVNRVARLTLPATYETQLQNIQKSPKFKNGQAVSFPGYSVLTPPHQEDLLNGEFYDQLTTTQQQLLEQLEPKIFIPVPPESFHLTLADLIWDTSYQASIQDDPNFDDKLKNSIRDSFEKYQNLEVERGKIQWQLLGLLVFPRALVMGLVPCHELSYEKIVQLRRAIYQNSDLMALGIEQRSHFTAHITLGYFDEIPAKLDCDRWANLLSSINDQWLGTEPQILTIEQVQLRKFEDMTNYLPVDHNPIVEF